MTDAPTSPDTPAPAQVPGAWTLWAVVRRGGGAGPQGQPGLAEAMREPAEGVTVRGLYDVSGLRADGDLMVWLHGDSAEALQAELRRLRRTTELAATTPTWNVMGVHRPAEFSADHAPAYMRDTRPRAWLTVYPFVRSYDWYLLPTDERRAMLAEHGRAGRAFTGVLANTVATFSLSDYEWVLGLESDELTDLVDLMRDLRATEARRHVREEVPFFTGRRIEAAEVAEVLR